MGIYVPWLIDAARMATAGTGRSVIVSPNWQTRGHGGLRLLEFVIGHHTATPETAGGDYPSLNVVQNGRAGLAGPLAQLGLGRSGNVYVIAAGLSYHAGASAYAGFVDLNDEAIGIEAEDSGDGRWTEAELFMYPRLVGAVLYYLRRGVDRYASHRTIAVPAGRKPDPAGITDTWMRDRASEFLAGGGSIPTPEDDMAFTPQELQNNVYAAVRNLLIDINNGVPGTEGALNALIGIIESVVKPRFDALDAKPTADVDEAALAAELVKQGFSGDVDKVLAALKNLRLVVDQSAPSA